MKTLRFIDLGSVVAGSSEGGDPGTSGSQSGASSSNNSDGGTINGVGQLVGAAVGATLCMGTPAVPYCAAAGAFVGANIPTESSSSPRVMLSDITAP